MNCNWLISPLEEGGRAEEAEGRVAVPASADTDELVRTLTNECTTLRARVAELQEKLKVVDEARRDYDRSLASKVAELLEAKEELAAFKRELVASKEEMVTSQRELEKLKEKFR